MERSPVDADADADPPAAGRRGWLTAAALLAFAGLALLVPVVAAGGRAPEADRAVADWLHRVALAEPGWTRASRILTDWVWDPITLRLLTLAVAVALWVRRARRTALWLVAASTLGWVLQHGLKLGVARERPRWAESVDSAHGWAFPSGHTMTATLTCGLLLALLLPRVRGRAGRILLWSVAVGSSVGVGFTRVHLGVHWSSDVLAGWLLGAAVVALAVALRVPEQRRPAGRIGAAPAP